MNIVISWSLLASIYPTEGRLEMGFGWRDFTKAITATGFYLQAVRKYKLHHLAFCPAENNVGFRVVFGKNASAEKQILSTILEINIVL